MSAKTSLLKLNLMSPWVLGGIALAILVLGGYLQIGENARAAQGIEGGILGMTTFGFLSKVAGVIGLAALAKFVLSSGTPDEETSLQTDPTEQPGEPEPTMPDASYVQPTSIISDDDMPAPRRSLGLRKALIVLIGGAFAVMLASVVWGLVSDTLDDQGTAQVSIPSAQEPVAQTAADTIVPDADSNRRWTDIDVTPVVEWGVAKFHLALSGDLEAQMLLGMIGGSVLFALFLLKFYFRLRRAMQPKTTAHIGGMGIN